MIDVSLENINLFQSKYTDENDDTSIEAFLDNAGVVINTIDDLTKARMALKLVLHDAGNTKSGENCKVEKFVKQGDADSYLVIVDRDLITAFICDDTSVITEFIKALINIPSTATLFITPFLMEPDISIWMMYDVIAVLNLLKHLPCKKVLNFGAQFSVADLLVGMYCDEIVVSKYAAVSIAKASTGDHIPRAMHNAYSHLVKNLYNYWIEKGLFTQEEVEGLFSSESTHHISLQSDEIIQRLP